MILHTIIYLLLQWCTGCIQGKTSTVEVHITSAAKPINEEVKPIPKTVYKFSLTTTGYCNDTILLGGGKRPPGNIYITRKPMEFYNSPVLN